MDTLQLNKTYALNNVRVKFTKYEHYLNSPKNEEMKATEVTPYTVPLVEYKDEVGTSSTVNGIILGVQQTSKSLCCISCQKRTVNITTIDKAVCQSCNLIQLPTTAKQTELYVFCSNQKIHPRTSTLEWTIMQQKPWSNLSILPYNLNQQQRMT